ncbi:hypothetical protein [Methylobacterium sp. A54F]
MVALYGTVASGGSNPAAVLASAFFLANATYIVFSVPQAPSGRLLGIVAGYLALAAVTLKQRADRTSEAQRVEAAAESDDTAEMRLELAESLLITLHEEQQKSLQLPAEPAPEPPRLLIGSLAAPLAVTAAVAEPVTEPEPVTETAGAKEAVAEETIREEAGREEAAREDAGAVKTVALEAVPTLDEPAEADAKGKAPKALAPEAQEPALQTAA